jgi:hypothetical protein
MDFSKKLAKVVLENLHNRYIVWCTEVELIQLLSFAVMLSVDIPHLAQLSIQSWTK